MIYQNLPSSDNAARLASGDDGDVYFEPVNPSSTSVLWAATSGVLGDDFQGRLLQVYIGELQNQHVSRTRLSDKTAFPSTGSVPGFVGVSTSGTNVLVAMDTSGGIYYPTACIFQDQASKLFVFKHRVQSLANLQTPLVNWTVTSGVVTGSAMVGIISPSVLASI